MINKSSSFCARLKLYRVNGAPKGHKKTDKTRRRREAAVKRRQLVAERQERRRARLEHKQQSARLAAGLPLLTEAELEWLTED